MVYASFLSDMDVKVNIYDSMHVKKALRQRQQFVDTRVSAAAATDLLEFPG